MVIFPKKRTIASQVCERLADKYLKNKSDNSIFSFTLSDYRVFVIKQIWILLKWHLNFVIGKFTQI